MPLCDESRDGCRRHGALGMLDVILAFSVCAHAFLSGGRMFEQMLRFVSSHRTVGALVYSWGSFEIGRMYFNMGRKKGGFLWGGLGILAAIVYFFVAGYLREWSGLTLLGVTVELEIRLMRRWFSADSQGPQPSG